MSIANDEDMMLESPPTPFEKRKWLAFLKRKHNQQVGPSGRPLYEPHQGEGRQYLRDIILGVNDGICSMILLIVGVVGGGFNSNRVLLVGITGGIAGAVSMGLGEYMATKSQIENYEGEMKLEKVHFLHHREVEIAEIKEQLEKWNVREPVLTDALNHICENDDIMLEFMKVMEFGQNEKDMRKPWKAMLVSFSLFVLGSLPSVLPFIFLQAHDATILAIVLAGIALFVVGAVKTNATRGNWLHGGIENITLSGIGALISFGIGYAYSGKG